MNKPYFFIDQSLRYDFERRAFNIDLSDLVDEIMDAVEEIACDTYSELTQGRTYISDDPTPKEGYIPITKEWQENSHDSFRTILLDRLADSIGERKSIRETERTDSEPCEINDFEF